MARDTPPHHRTLKRYILPDEQVVLAMRHHWGKLVEPVVTTAATFALVAFAVASVEPIMGEPARWLWVLGIAAFARLTWKVLEWRNEWFVGTDKRMLLLYGLITHRVAMMPLGKVTDMNYARSPVGRILGYGQFLLESAGQDQAMRQIDWVRNPDVTYRRLCDTIFGPAGRDKDEDELPSEDAEAPPAADYRPGTQPIPVRAVPPPLPPPVPPPVPGPPRPPVPWPTTDAPTTDVRVAGTTTGPTTEPTVVPRPAERPAGRQAAHDAQDEDDSVPGWEVSDEGRSQFVRVGSGGAPPSGPAASATTVPRGPEHGAGGPPVPRPPAIPRPPATLDHDDPPPPPPPPGGVF